MIAATVSVSLGRLVSSGRRTLNQCTQRKEGMTDSP